MKNKISIMVAIIFSLALLAACAPEPAEPQTTPTPAPVETPAPTPSPTPEGEQEDNNGDDVDDTTGENGNIATPEGLEDGVYTGQSDKDDRGNYGEVTITIANEEITDVEYIEYSEDGNPKNEENGYEYEEALDAFEELPQQLMETQDVNEVDDYSGATSTSNHFKMAVQKALSSEPNGGAEGEEQDTDGEIDETEEDTEDTTG